MLAIYITSHNQATGCAYQIEGNPDMNKLLAKSTTIGIGKRLLSFFIACESNRTVAPWPMTIAIGMHDCIYNQGRMPPPTHRY